MTPIARRDLLPGMLDMLILKTLSIQSMHGYAIAQHLLRLSRDVIRVEEGSLYPALQRMLVKGWLKDEWGALPRTAARDTIASRPRGGSSSSVRRNPTSGSPARSR